MPAVLLLIMLSARSPTFTGLRATLLGLQTIRAFGSQGKIQQDFDGYHDNHTAA